MNTDEHRCRTGRTRSRAKSPALALLTLGLLTSCAGGYDAQTSLRNALDEFHDGFRWQAMGSMLPHIPPEDQDSFAAEYEAAMDGVQVADYEVDRIVIADDKESANVWVSFSWFRNTEMMVHEVTVREHWVADGMQWNRTEVAVERGELP